jgi:hypothetical protein
MRRIYIAHFPACGVSSYLEDLRRSTSQQTTSEVCLQEFPRRERMLSVGKRLLPIRWLSSVPTRLCSTHANKVLVNDVKHLTAVALKLLTEKEVSSALELLTKVREGAEMTHITEFHEGFSGKTWLSDWICSASTSQKFKVFPFSVDDKKESSLSIREDLANSILAIRMAATDPKTARTVDKKKEHEEAVKSSHALADYIGPGRLRQISPVFKAFIGKEMNAPTFYSELTERVGIMAHHLMPMLTFSKMDVPWTVQEKFVRAKSRYHYLHKELLAALTNLVRIRSTAAYFQETAEPKAKKKRGAPKTTDPAATVKSQVKKMKKAYPMPGGAVQVSRLDCTLQDDGKSFEHVRSQSGTQPAGRPGPNLLFSAEMTCFDARQPMPSAAALDGFPRHHLGAVTPNVFNVHPYGADPWAESVPSVPTHAPWSSQPVSTTPQPQLRAVLENLPPGITPESIVQQLKACGEVERVWLFRDDRMTPEEVLREQEEQRKLMGECTVPCFSVFCVVVLLCSAFDLYCELSGRYCHSFESRRNVWLCARTEHTAWVAMGATLGYGSVAYPASAICIPCTELGDDDDEGDNKKKGKHKKKKEIAIPRKHRMAQVRIFLCSTFYGCIVFAVWRCGVRCASLACTVAQSLRVAYGLRSVLPVSLISPHLKTRSGAL